MVKRSLLIVDDHQIILDGLTKLLADDEMVYVKKTATSAGQAIDILQNDTFNYILLDISMPDMSGLQLLEHINKMDINSRVIMLTMHQDYYNAKKALDSGAHGYILKIKGIAEIKEAICNIDKGMSFVSKEIAIVLNGIMKISDAQSPGISILTGRELEVAKLIASGKSGLQIASQLYLSPKTVSTHRRNIFSKLNISKTASLIKMIYESGMMGKE